MPELAVPVLITIAPLTPDDPLFEVRSSSDPLELLDPTPDEIETWPPVAAVE